MLKVLVNRYYYNVLIRARSSSTPTPNTFLAPSLLYGYNLLSFSKRAFGIVNKVYAATGCFSRPNFFNDLKVRWTTYGQEYQPSSLRRKRKFGFLARIRSREGRKILKRRIMKGRKYLSA